MAEPDDNPILETEFGPTEESPKTFLDDASDVAQIKRKGRRKKIAEDNGLLFWQKALNDPAGRREFWQILKDGHAFSLVVGFAPNGSESSTATLYKIGQQQMVLRLYHKWLSAFPQLVYLMHAENDDRFAQAGSKQSKAIVTNGPGPDSDQT